MTRTLRMYDAVNVDHIPEHAPMVAGYVDGRYVTVAKLRKKFPGARLVTITVTGNTLDAHVADVETGDLTPEHGARWARDKIAAGHHPTLYCAESNWSAVRAALRAGAVDPHRVSFWIASYDNDSRIPRGAVAKQYATGDYDISTVGPRWPGVLPTDLARGAASAAHKLTAHLSRRNTPLRAIGRAELEALVRQIDRVSRLP